MTINLQSILLLCFWLIASGHAVMEREVWLLQTMPRQTYFDAVHTQAYSDTPIGPINLVSHTLIFGSNGVDGPLEISSYMQDQAVGPKVTQYSRTTDINVLLRHGLDGNLLYLLTGLGTCTATNKEIFDVTEGDRGTPPVTRGSVSDIWARLMGRAQNDPTISVFMLEYFQLLRQDLRAPFPGLAGQIFAAYRLYRDLNPTLYQRYTSRPDILSVNEDPYDIQYHGVPEPTEPTEHTASESEAGDELYDPDADPFEFDRGPNVEATANIDALQAQLHVANPGMLPFKISLLYNIGRDSI